MVISLPNMLKPWMRYVCVSFCLCVCVCLSVTEMCSETIGPILIKLVINNLILNLRRHCSHLLNNFAALSSSSPLSFLQIYIACCSVYDIVLNCKPAFSVSSFNSIWPTKMAKLAVKNDCAKRKTKSIFMFII